MDKYDNVRIGLNSRLDTLQAAVLLAKFDCFVNEEIDAVNSVAKKYSECLVNFVDVPIIKEGFLSSWAQYTIKVKDKENRDKIQIFFNENGIPSMVYYSKPLHFQKAFKESTNQYVSLNNTVELCNKVLSLPMHPYMQKAEVYKIIKAIKNYYV